MMDSFKVRYLLLAVLLFSSGISQAQITDEKEEKQSNWFWEMLFGEDEEESYENNTTEDQMVMKIDLSKPWHFSIGDDPRWSAIGLNDSNWEKIDVPEDWENEGFNGYDGYAWYRTKFDGRSLNKSQAHFLVLGFIDDVDETFLNGNMIGRSGRFPSRYRTAYNSKRQYYIPNDRINFNGLNVIAVRVYDEGRNGGIVAGKPGIYVPEGSEELDQSLYGSWAFKKGNDRSYSESDYDDSDWDKQFVPSFWDNQGYRMLDGIAWYRKEFNLTFTLNPDKTYYLVLGKIDDFDMTYLNGRKIGETNDKLEFGRTTSYQKIRVYIIPPGLLNASGKNVIAVKVLDIGDKGGIYKGPIGIVESSKLTRTVRRDF